METDVGVEEKLFTMELSEVGTIIVAILSASIIADYLLLLVFLEGEPARGAFP